MNAQLKRLFMGMVGLMLGVGSCTLGVAPPTPTSDNSAAALTLTALVQTMTAQAATIPAAASPTLPPEGLATATELPPAVPPTMTAVILTSTFTPLPTTIIPMVSVTTGTNCRSGPGVVYDKIGGAPEGVRFVLVGKNTQTNYWIIRLQNGQDCWLWGRYAVVEGNVAALPEYAIPALPVGSVAGAIKDYAGTGIPNATVTALLSQKSVTTAGNGAYTIDDLRTGTEFIDVRAGGYFAERRTVSISQGAVFGADFTLTGGVPGGPGPMRAVVEGLVLINGAPAVGAHVWAWDVNSEAFTDNSGRYRINLPDEANILLLADLGDRRGGVEIWIPRDQTLMTAPDILILQR